MTVHTLTIKDAIVMQNEVRKSKKDNDYRWLKVAAPNGKGGSAEFGMFAPVDDKGLAALPVLEKIGELVLEVSCSLNGMSPTLRCERLVSPNGKAKA